jgi:hypothetical protein
VINNPFQANRPPRIEDDPSFAGWTRALPRLWYLDQRHATRLDAETLSGASEYAVFYSRTTYTTISSPAETATIGVINRIRQTDTDIGIPAQTGTRQAAFIRSASTSVSLTQTPGYTRPTGSPINPIVHPMLGDPI